jgi:hypothetical protein
MSYRRAALHLYPLVRFASAAPVSVTVFPTLVAPSIWGGVSPEAGPDRRRGPA